MAKRKAQPGPAQSSEMLGSFLSLDKPYSDYDEARFAILPVPYDGTVSYLPGSRLGPDAILAASDQLELLDDELLFETCRAGITTLPPVEINMSGAEQMHNDIFHVARKIVQDGKFLFSLGGEHSITSALVRAIATKNKKFSILQIDAHLDMRNEYLGTRYSHASVMRRCLEYSAVKSIVPVGIRNICVEELEFIKEASIQPVPASECGDLDFWLDPIMDHLEDKIYVTIDIDGFDPAVAPGTGTPVPGGLDWYCVTDLLRSLATYKTIIGADIVEVLPIPGQVATEYLAAKLAYRLMGYVVAAETGKLTRPPEDEEEDPTIDLLL